MSERAEKPHEPRVVALAREHPGVVLTLAYVVATGIGLLSSWTLFSFFDVNILDYAEAGDFLIAAIRTPVATLAILLAVPAVWLVFQLDAFVRKHSPNVERIYRRTGFDRLVMHPAAYVVSIVLYAWLAALLYADRVATRLESGRAATVEVRLQTPVDGESALRGQVLGSMRSYFFLYDVARHEVSVIPVENIALITPLRGS